MARSRPGGNTPTLPAWKAFVVQFAADSALRGARCTGRVEHLSSGRRVAFASKEELVQVLGQMLDDLDQPDEG